MDVCVCVCPYVCMSFDHICDVVKPYDDASLRVSMDMYIYILLIVYDGMKGVGFASGCSSDQSDLR